MVITVIITDVDNLTDCVAITLNYNTGMNQKTEVDCIFKQNYAPLQFNFDLTSENTKPARVHVKKDSSSNTVLLLK